MRVVLYTDAVETGGAEVSLRNLAAHLDPELEVTILGVDPGVVEFLAGGRSSAQADVIRRPVRSLDDRALRAHARALRALRPGILHCNLWSPWSCQYAVAGSLAVPSTRVVAVYQLLVPAANRQQHLLKRLTSLRVAAHVGVGQRTAREVEALIPLRRGTARTIHNGITPDEPPGKRPKQDARPTIGASGRIEHQKGLDVLLEALTALPQANLRVIGDGSARAGLERLAARLGVADRVTWTGWTRNPRAELATIDVFVQPARFEGFPLAILEAMVAELPVVATDVGSVADAVVDGLTGMLVPPEDPAALAGAIESLLDDPHRRAEIGRQARARVLEQFTAERMAAAFESLYRELVS